MKQGIDNQPVGKVQWVDRNTLNANDYNPNFVAPPELQLLKTSIIEDGWTQPIVILSDNYPFHLIETNLITGPIIQLCRSG